MDVRHSIIGISELLDWAVSLGLCKQALLEDTHITDAMLEDPHVTVLPEQELTFYSNLSKLSDDPLIAYNAGCRLNAGTYGIWGLALLSSESFESAIKTGLKYLAFTYTYNHIYFKKGDSTSALYLDPKLSDRHIREFMTERDLGAIQRLFVDLLEQKHKPIKEVHLKAKALGHKIALEEALGCPVRLGSTHNKVVFDNQYLAVPLPQANQLTMKMCYQQMDAMLPERTLRTTVTQRVIGYLSSHTIEQAKLVQVADFLNMSERSLRRKLAEEETSFQQIVNDYKKLLAKDFLENTSLTMEEIAEKLGYSDSAGFSNAYKRWYGVAPSFHSKH